MQSESVAYLAADCRQKVIPSRTFQHNRLASSTAPRHDRVPSETHRVFRPQEVPASHETRVSAAAVDDAVAADAVAVGLGWTRVAGNFSNVTVSDGTKCRS